jgi:hypothetical protein
VTYHRMNNELGLKLLLISNASPEDHLEEVLLSELMSIVRSSICGSGWKWNQTRS